VVEDNCGSHCHGRGVGWIAVRPFFVPRPSRHTAVTQARTTAPPRAANTAADNAGNTARGEMSATAKILFVLAALGCGSQPFTVSQPADSGPIARAAARPWLCSEGARRDVFAVCALRVNAWPRVHWFALLAPATASDAGILGGVQARGDPLCGQGSSCIVGCPLQGMVAFAACGPGGMRMRRH